MENMDDKIQELISVFILVDQGSLSLREAAERVEKSYRHIRRLYHRYCENGEEGLLHGLRGKPSNRRISTSVRKKIIADYKDYFRDLGPGPAARQLAQRGYKISRETLRRWLIDEGLWEFGRRMSGTAARKKHFGELLLLICRNSSVFKNKSKCRVLLVVDDATHTCMCRVVQRTAEAAAMKVLDIWVKKYGIPMGIACDSHYLNKSTLTTEEPERTEMLAMRRALGKALEKLGIEVHSMSCSNIRQRLQDLPDTYMKGVLEEIKAARAGSVVQVNSLLQSPAAASLDTLCAGKPAASQDFHVRLQPGDKTDKIFCCEYETVVSKKGLITHNKRTFRIIEPQAESPAPMRQTAAIPSRVMLAEYLNGSVHIFRGKTELSILEMR
jgi:transposase